MLLRFVQQRLQDGSAFLRWWDEDRGPVDCLWPAGIRRAAMVAFVQREHTSSDGCPARQRDRWPMDARRFGDQAGECRYHDTVDHRDHPGGGKHQLPCAGCEPLLRQPVSPGQQRRRARVAGRSRATSRSDARTGSPRWRTEPDAGMSMPRRMPTPATKSARTHRTPLRAGTSVR